MELADLIAHNGKVRFAYTLHTLCIHSTRAHSSRVPLSHSTPSLLSCTPLIHSLSSTALIHSSPALLSYTPLTHRLSIRYSLYTLKGHADDKCPSKLHDGEELKTDVELVRRCY
jgi:hypothetical protein